MDSVDELLVIAPKRIIRSNVASTRQDDVNGVIKSPERRFIVALRVRLLALGESRASLADSPDGSNASVAICV
mgnify:CR=1 FL=1